MTMEELQAVLKVKKQESPSEADQFTQGYYAALCYVSNTIRDWDKKKTTANVFTLSGGNK